MTVANTFPNPVRLGVWVFGQILCDAASGWDADHEYAIPPSFELAHDYVDANEYIIQARQHWGMTPLPDFDNQEECDFDNQVVDVCDGLLRFLNDQRFKNPFTP